jgi:hypothetical protein
MRDMVGRLGPFGHFNAGYGWERCLVGRVFLPAELDQFARDPLLDLCEGLGFRVWGLGFRVWG